MEWPVHYFFKEQNSWTYYNFKGLLSQKEGLRKICGKKGDEVIPYALPVCDKDLMDYFYLHLKRREKKKYKRQSKYKISISKTNGRNSFKRYFEGELHYLDEFDFYGMLYLNSCYVKFDCDWGHVHAGTWHSADVVGEKDGKPVVVITSWPSSKGRSSTRCTMKTYKLSEVFVFNPKYSYDIRRKSKVNYLVRRLRNFRDNLRYRKAHYTKSFGTRWMDANGNYRYPDNMNMTKEE